MEGNHAGHRSRMVAKIRSDVLSVTETDILEVVLCQYIPRRDTRPIAEELLRRFQSVANVFQASMESLLAVPGIGYKTAQKLVMYAYDMVDSIEDKMLMPAEFSIRNVMDYMKHYMKDLQTERFLIVAFNADGKYLKTQIVKSDSSEQVKLDPFVFAAFIADKSVACVVIAHNHPHGAAYPSAADDQATKECNAFCLSAGVYLADHQIVAGNECFSYQNSGRLQAIRKESELLRKIFMNMQD